MKTNAGLWIDHREAVVVVLSESGETTTRIRSGASKQPRRSSEPSEGKFKGHEAPADDSRGNELAGRLDRYYDEIVSSLRGASSILIFGPGEAKGELKKKFAAREGGPSAVAVETAGRMTEPQIAAQVRRHFHSAAARRGS